MEETGVCLFEHPSDSIQAKQRFSVLIFLLGSQLLKLIIFQVQEQGCEEYVLVTSFTVGSCVNTWMAM